MRSTTARTPSGRVVAVSWGWSAAGSRASSSRWRAAIREPSPRARTGGSCAGWCWPPPTAPPAPPCSGVAGSSAPGRLLRRHRRCRRWSRPSPCSTAATSRPTAGCRRGRGWPSSTSGHARCRPPCWPPSSRGSWSRWRGADDRRVLRRAGAGGRRVRRPRRHRADRRHRSGRAGRRLGAVPCGHRRDGSRRRRTGGATTAPPTTRCRRGCWPAPSSRGWPSCPTVSDIADWRLPGRDVVTPMLFIATVPLLVAGALIELIRRSPGGPERTAHRVVEWATLTAGILIVYTALVAGLGQLVGGSGPTWFLVAATGVIALALEPGRQRVRRLVDRLVYGSRDDPLGTRPAHRRPRRHRGRRRPAAVRRARASSVSCGWRPWRSTCPRPTAGSAWRSSGPPTPHHREVVLRHGDEVVGRLVVGWEHGPSLRPRDEHVLSQITGPLTLAVRWVRLAARAATLERGHRGRPRGGAAATAPRSPRRHRSGADRHLARTCARRCAASAVPAMPADVVSATALLERLADEVDAVVDRAASRSSAGCVPRSSTSSVCWAPSPSSPASSTTTCRSTSRCRATRCGCPPRSRWRRTAS